MIRATGPSAMTRPASSTMRRSQASTVDMRWVIITTAIDPRRLAHQHLGVAGQRSRQAEALLLTAAQPTAALPHVVAVAVGERHDLVVQVRQACSSLDVGIGEVIAQEADVVGHRAAQQMRRLRHERHSLYPLGTGQ